MDIEKEIADMKERMARAFGRIAALEMKNHIALHPKEPKGYWWCLQGCGRLPDKTEIHGSEEYGRYHIPGQTKTGHAVEYRESPPEPKEYLHANPDRLPNNTNITEPNADTPADTPESMEKYIGYEMEVSADGKKWFDAGKLLNIHRGFCWVSRKEVGYKYCRPTEQTLKLFAAEADNAELRMSLTDTCNALTLAEAERDKLQLEASRNMGEVERLKTVVIDEQNHGNELSAGVEKLRETIKKLEEEIWHGRNPE